MCAACCAVGWRQKSRALQLSQYNPMRMRVKLMAACGLQYRIQCRLYLHPVRLYG